MKHILLFCLLCIPTIAFADIPMCTGPECEYASFSSTTVNDAACKGKNINAPCTDASNNIKTGKCIQVNTGSAKKISCLATECTSRDYFIWKKNNTSQGVCVHRNQLDTWCQQRCTTNDECFGIIANDNKYFSCEKQQSTTPEYEPYIPTPPAPQPTNCTLKFRDGQTLTNIDTGISTKQQNNRFSIYRGRMANNSDPIQKQNQNPELPSYDANTPHLFDVISINDAPIPNDTLQKLQSEEKVTFECNNNNPKITLPPVKQTTPNAPESPTINPTPNPTPDQTPTVTVISTPSMCRGSDCYSSNIFTRLKQTLDEHFDSSSVWKDESGNFNTARLASDSIAGIVLGTVGGIVTSNIIKKNQIEKGFDDLKCTIAGQDIASYGDEFTIGAK